MTVKLLVWRDDSSVNTSHYIQSEPNEGTGDNDPRSISWLPPPAGTEVGEGGEKVWQGQNVIADKKSDKMEDLHKKLNNIVESKGGRGSHWSGSVISITPLPPSQSGAASPGWSGRGTSSCTWWRWAGWTPPLSSSSEIIKFQYDQWSRVGAKTGARVHLSLFNNNLWLVWPLSNIASHTDHQIFNSWYHH